MLEIVAAMGWTQWRIFLVAITGWINRQQVEAIAFYKEKNTILRDRVGPKRVILDVSQKRRLMVADTLTPASSWRRSASFCEAADAVLAFPQPTPIGLDGDDIQCMLHGMTNLGGILSSCQRSTRFGIIGSLGKRD